MNPHDPRKLERAVHEALRDLPDRRAPASLESRVHAEIARRAALPWWRRNFQHWPMAARVLFYVVSAVVVQGMLSATMWTTAGMTLEPVRVALAPQIDALRTLLSLAGSLAELAFSAIRPIPVAWLYGAAAVVVALYVALFGLGAAAYRTLYVPAHSTR